MDGWPRRPTFYEINTWVWLDELSRRQGRWVTLADVPAGEWDRLAALPFDAVWLMGVWERSPTARRLARSPSLLDGEYRGALRDVGAEDVVGSPYSVHRYIVEPRFGGREGLHAARTALAQRGQRLLLDFLPNHVAIDHPWTLEHPEVLIQGSLADLEREPRAFFESAGRVFAHGRDPHFPPWSDTAQLNAFQPGLRQEVLRTLLSIAGCCDGVRCDMAMLVLNRVFKSTWGSRAGAEPSRDFWPEVIDEVKRHRPDFLFVAEVYWGLEAELLKQGFDYAYDKQLRDLLFQGDAEGVHRHLGADARQQDRLVRFVENHDESRAAAVLAPEMSRTVAMAALTLLGARLLFEGQLEGAAIRLPVQLGRRPQERPDADLQTFYRKLLAETALPVFREGEWALCERSGWPDNQGWRSVLAWCWRKEEHRRLVALNLSRAPVQALVHIPWPELAGRSWELYDPFEGGLHVVEGAPMAHDGWYVELPPAGRHFLRVREV